MPRAACEHRRRRRGGAQRGPHRPGRRRRDGLSQRIFVPDRNLDRPGRRLDEPYAWAWDLDGDTVPDAAGSAVYGAAAAATAAFATEGVYVLTFTVTDADGADGQDSVQVTVLNHAPDCSAVTASPAAPLAAR